MAERKARRNQAPLVDRELLAYHEAGHAVLARVLRMGLRCVIIVWDPVLESPGHCLHGRGGDVDPNFTTRAGYASNQRYIRKEGLFLYGGLAAEACFDSDSVTTTEPNHRQRAGTDSARRVVTISTPW
jgi:ATP-dependent Zn protease